MTLFPMLFIWLIVLFIAFYGLWKGLTTGEIPMKKGLVGTPLENSKALYWIQMALLAILAAYAVSVFASIFTASL